MRIICPYCFEEFNDDEVHFRVPIMKDPDSSALPDDVDTLSELQSSKRYTDEEKLEIATRYWQANFYEPREDKLYKEFWDKFDTGTTEPILHNNKYPPYWKRIIEPKRDIKLLRQLDHSSSAKTLDSCFRRDSVVVNGDRESFVSEIQLEDGTSCSERVCPKCHNPLPDYYGAFPVKFISIVGITHSGKTVYLSQFFKHFVEKLEEVGYTCPGYTPSMTNFVNKNVIDIGKELPAGTSACSFQQPIICEIVHEQNKQTIVLYDVAGELFGDNQRFNAAEVNSFAEFIRHSDAIMMLIDPMQFEVLQEVLHLEEKRLEAPNAAIVTLHTVLGDRSHDIPFAVCISKCDEIYKVMSDDLKSVLSSAEYRGIPSEDNEFLRQAVFNAQEFNSYEQGLTEFVVQKNRQIYGALRADYDNFAFFGISALGCPVEKDVSENGKEISTPKGPISPKRIMDPFYWIMYKLGLLGASGAVFNPNGSKCPKCQNQTTIKLKTPITEEKGFGPWKKTTTYTDYCESCNVYFNRDTKESNK